MRDYYAVLQVRPDADAEVIAAAYRSLARKYHPDHSHDEATAQRMRELNEAYETLSDPGRRRHYDATLPARRAPMAPPVTPSRVRTEEMRRPAPATAPMRDEPVGQARKRGRGARPVVLSVVWIGCLVGAIAAMWAVWQAETNTPPPIPTPRVSGTALPSSVVTPLSLPSRTTVPTATGTPAP
jgi:hypothetical protein